MRYHYKKPDIYLSMYGKLYIYAIIRCMTDVHYLQLAIKVWQLFSKDSIRIQRLHTGQRLIPG